MDKVIEAEGLAQINFLDSFGFGRATDKKGIFANKNKQDGGEPCCGKAKSINSQNYGIIHCITMISEGEMIMDPMKIRNIQRLKEIEKLPMNWNENGAQPFSYELIKICRNILNILPEQPEIFPTAANSIQMEYEKENGEYLEFNVYMDRINVFKVDAFENEEEYSLGIQEEKALGKVVEDFYARNQ